MTVALRPSAAERWLACPASARFPPLPDDSNEYADEGSCAHDVAATALRHTDPERFVRDAVGTRVPIAEHRTYEFREDMVEPTVAYCRAAVAHAHAIGAKTWQVEQTVPIGGITGEFGATGTADFVAAGKNTLLVMDLKFGRGVRVSARGNPQLALYAAGVLEGLLPPAVAARMKYVALGVSQPRVALEPELWTVSVPEFRALVAQLRVGAERALRHPDPPYVPGEVQCRWCPAKLACAARRKHVEEAVALDPSNVAPEVLADLLRRAGAVEDWLSDVRSQSLAVALKGTALPGWKVVQGRAGPRRWSDAGLAEKALLSKLPPEKAFERTLISPTEAEKALGKQVYAAVAAPLVARAAGALTLAEETDPRTAVPCGSAAVQLADEAHYVDDLL